MDYVSIRHQLHQLAEPSGKETATQGFILELLQKIPHAQILTFDNSRNIIVIFDSHQDGPTILFRSDFDAVRVDETIDIPYFSKNQGVSHKCGHDGHATILLCLAEKISQKPITKGKVLLFFQAGEETGEGAQQLLDTPTLEQYKPDRVFALHNIPGEELGTVLCKAKSFTCSVISCDINLHGHTSHASEPQKALSPYPAAKAITDKLLEFNQYDIKREDFQLATLVEFRVGEPAYGVTAGHGVLRFTLRAKNDALLQKTKRELIQIVEQETAKYEGLTCDISWKEYFAASNNQAEAVESIKRAAGACQRTYKELDIPFPWGEDFGLLTQYFDGALFGLGSGVHQPSLHHPLFDFPDDLVPIGLQLFEELLKNNQ